MKKKDRSKGNAGQRPDGRAARAPFVKAIYQENRGMFALSGAMMLVSSLLDIVVAYILQQTLDTAVSGSMERLGFWALFALGYFGLYWAVWMVLRSTKQSYVKKAMLNYKGYAFERITKKSMGSFGEETTGRYISALTNDAASVETNYVPSSLKLICQITWFVASIAMMLWYSWQLTAIVLGLCCLPVVISLGFGGRLVKEEKSVSDCSEGFVGMVKDLLSGFSVIKSFQAEKEAGELFRQENERLEQKKYKRRMTEDMITIISSGAGFLVQFGVMFAGVYLCLRGSITAGVVIAFVQLMNYVLQPVQQLPGIIANRRAAEGLMEKLAGAVAVNTQREGKAVNPALNQAISVEGLRFGYEPGVPVLDGVSVRFEAGKSYAVVGGSGSGKTTLLNLLMGGWDGYEGEIRYDENELRQIGSDSLYEMLSLIQQNVFVFDNTVRANITMFKDFPRERIDSAIRRSGLEEFMRTHGEAYPCGENGSGLSGGEKQRISIARCLLRGTPVLLMDEATAALDAETAFEVTSAVLDVEGLTRIVVTHRLEAPLLKRFDEILVLHRGRIEEKGSFDSLMENRGYFYSLYNVSI